MKQLQAFVQEQFPAIQKEWFEFLRFKSISSHPALHHESRACASWLEKKLRKIGLAAERIETAGLPLVYGEDLSAGPKAPTLLIYGHYDVQPVDPIELWHSDPFEPVVKEGKVYARGAQDDKGQIFYAIEALRALKELKRDPAVNIKVLIEGEEESGSQGLTKQLPQLKEKLKADSILIVDFGIKNPETPSICLGARGIVTFDVVLRGSKSDLHSGSYGGVAYNPNRALSELLAKCWEESGRVRVPHFYDDVAELSAAEKRICAEAGKEFHLKEAGIEALGGERGFSLQEANWLRPTLEINGISGGYNGPGFKTVIPAKASAKLSCRLVPDQDPEKIGRLVAAFLKQNVQPGVRIDVSYLPGGRAYRGRADSQLALAALRAYEELFGRSCARLLAGGSIPVIAGLMETIGGDVVGMGYGLASDDIHGPNEHFGIDRVQKGLVTVARLIEHLGGK